MATTTEVVSGSNQYFAQAAQDFVDNLNASTNGVPNYDLYANQYPVLHQLKQLAKITAVVKWIHDNNIPLDMTFWNQYQIVYEATPTSTPVDTVSGSYTTSNGTTYNVGISGGVDLSDANIYQPDSTSASALGEAAVASQPSQPTASWTFTQNGTTYNAVSLSLGPSLLPGGYTSSSPDISMPTRGAQPLEFTRKYSSAATAAFAKQTAMGYGWTYMPAEIIFPAENYKATCSGTNQALYRQLTVNLAGKRELFELGCLSSSAVYTPTDSKFHDILVPNADGTYTLQVDALGRSGGNLYAATPTSTYKFNSQGQPTAQTDRNGNIIQYSYGSNGLLASISDPAGRSIAVSYDSSNRVAEVTDPMGQKTSYAYDAAGDLRSFARAGKNIFSDDFSSGVEDNGWQTQLYDDFSAGLDAWKNTSPNWTGVSDAGNPVAQGDGLGGPTVAWRNAGASDLNYFTAKVKITDTNASNATAGLVLRSDADTYGPDHNEYYFGIYPNEDKWRLWRVVNGNFGASPVASGNQTIDPGQYYTVSARAEGGTIRVFVDGAEKASYTDSFPYAYANVGLRARNAKAYFDDASVTEQIVRTYGYDNHLLTSLTDPDGTEVWRIRSYDLLGRVTDASYADGTSKTIDYDDQNHRLTSRDAAGNETISQFDTDGQLLSRTDPLNNTTSYTYDPTSVNPVTVTDPKGGTTTFTLDQYGFGHVTAMTDPNGNTTTFSWDINKNLLNGFTDPRPDPGPYSTIFTYDQSGNLTGKTEAYEEVHTSYGRDEYGQMTSKTDPKGNTTTYTYDPYGDLASTTDPLGNVTSYTYDTNGNRTSFAEPKGNGRRAPFSAPFTP